MRDLLRSLLKATAALRRKLTRSIRRRLDPDGRKWPRLSGRPSGGGPSDRLKEAFRQATTPPAALGPNFRRLALRFAREGRTDLFLDLLLANGPKTFSRLDLIAETFKVGAQIGRAEDVSAAIGRLASAGALPSPAWGPDDYLGHMKPLGPEISLELAILKYRGAPNLRQDLFAGAEILGSRLAVPRAFLDHLYDVSRFRSMARSDWERDVRTAFCLDQITADMQRRPRPELNRELGFSFAADAARLVDREAVAAAFAGVDPARGLLLMTYHGGFLALAKGLFHDVYPTGLRLQSSTAGSGISVKNDHRAGLFRAVRSLQDGGRMLIAPDAGFGNKSNSIEVAGATVPVADGAAFLAYEAECQTAWFTVVRDRNLFKPLLVPGPTRQEAERYAAFKSRLLDFYARQFTEIATGEPWNLAFRTRWVRVFGRLERAPAAAL